MTKKRNVKRKDNKNYKSNKKWKANNTLMAGLLMVTVFILSMYGDKIIQTLQTTKYCIEYILGL